MRSSIVKVTLAAMILLLLAGCAAKKAFKDGIEAENNQNWDDAIFNYMVALKHDPDNVAYRLRLDNVRKKASRAHLNLALHLFKQEKEIESFNEFKLAIDLDPENENAKFQYKQSRDQYRKKIESERKKRRDELRQLTTSGVPELKIQSPKLITLDFNDRRVKEIYVAMGKLAGVNVFFEDTIKNNLTSFTVKDVSFLEALETFAMAQRHAIKVINDTSIFIYPDTAQMRKEYESQVVRVFFLEHLAAKTAREYIRTMLNFNRFQHSDELNAVILRGSPGLIAAAEKLLAILDRPQPEVILDVEVLEVSRNDLNNIGLLLGDDSSVTQSTLGTTYDAETETYTLGTNNISFAEFKNLGSQNLFLTVPSLTMNFLRQDSNTKLIAKPRISVIDKQKSTLHIGEAVPVRSTTYNYTTASGNVTPLDQYTYKDTGIKLEFEPTINNQLELILTLSIEVSTKLYENEDGIPTFGTKQIKSVIRLNDGETKMIAGLVKEETQTTITGIAGLSDIPLIGNLFSNDYTKTLTQDTIITITPYIIRSAELTSDDLKSLMVGTENSLGLSLAEILKKEDEGGEDQTVVIDNEKIDALVKDEDIPESTGGDDRPRPSIEDRRPPIPSSDMELQPDEQMEDTAPLSSGGTAQINIQPALVSTIADNQFSVQIVIQDAENVSHTPFYLMYDPAYLEVINISEGGFLGQDGKQVSFMHNINNATGEVRVGLSRLGTVEGVNGTGVLAVISFKAKEKGLTYLSFSKCNVKNPRAEDIPVECLTSEIKID
ncbi:MAG: hypothetical protein JW737_05175 [Acidobacteria bacterium]|nr:hypothetical protein [Acidobacteriota bacterium]